MLEKKKIYKEINSLKDLDHPNIVRIYEFFETENSIQIVMDKVLGKELFIQCMEKNDLTRQERKNIM